MKGILTRGISELKEGSGTFYAFCTHHGTAKAQGRELSLSAHPMGTPIITDDKTGRTWMPTWEELLDAAIEAGLFLPVDEAVFTPPERRKKKE